MSFFDFFKKLETARLARENKALEAMKTVLYKIVPELKNAKDKMAYKIPDDKLDLIKTLSQENLDTIRKHKLANIKTEKGPKEIFCNFFGMGENWSLKRNLIGGLMVHAPEYPTYFIPAFTQARTTGDAEDLKRGEGPRGIITGGLEGLAVGALVSGRWPKTKEMIPYICLGMALQFISSIVFPWLGEKTGQCLYKKNQEKMSKTTPLETESIPLGDKKTISPSNQYPTNLYQKQYAPKAGLKI